MSRPKALILVVLVVSAALRVWVAHSGGQFFWPDEGRYVSSMHAVSDLLQGQPGAAFREVFSRAGHVFFVVVALVPAALQSWGMPAWMAAVYFGLFSVGTIYLIGRISWVTSRDEGEALLAVVIAAGSSCLLYFSRHLLPYDPALFLGLLGLYCGLRAPRPCGCLFAGIWISLGFLTYNGYWVLCGVALVLVILFRLASPADFAARVLATGAGFALPVISIFFLSRAAGVSFFADLIRFSHTVTEGDYDEGWTLVWRYLWDAEGWLFVLWVILALAAGVLAVAGRRRHLLLWVLALALIYAALGELSAGLQRFVVYGRIARCLIPFFALSAAGALSAIGGAGRWGRWVLGFLVTAMLFLAAANFRPIIRQYFPPVFRAAALARSKGLPTGARGHLRVLNAYFFHQAVFVDLRLAHRTLLSAPHPLQYRPYQYEGYRRDQRALFNSHDIAMRLVFLEEDPLKLSKMPDPSLGGYLGPVRVTVMLPSKAGMYSEPLVVTGESEKGDFLYLKCAPERGTVQVGLDHWSYGGPVSDPIPVDYAKPHTFEISMGSLMPPAGSGAYSAHPEWMPLAQRIWVTMDGRTVFNQDTPFYASDATSVTVASNLIGGSTTDPNFGGVVVAMEPLEILVPLRELHIPAHPP